MADAAVYTINEGTLPLDVPGTCEDQTIHVLRLPGHGHATASMVITRETLPRGMTARGYAEQESSRMSETLPGIELHGRVQIAWPDETGEAFLTRWTSSEGPMDQIIACRRSYAHGC